MKQYSKILCACLMFSSIAHAQSSALDTVRARLDDSLFVSARAAGLGGAMSTLADGIQAPYYNPAAIGGVDVSEKQTSIVRQLYFPYLGAAANSNMNHTANDSSQGGSHDRIVGSGLVNAQAGKNHYGRFSGLASITVQRFILVQALDEQFSAQRAEGSTTLTHADFRNRSLSGLGLSLVGPAEQLYVGAFMYADSQKLMTGDLTDEQMNAATNHYELISKNSATYKGTPLNLGLTWILAKPLRPTLAIVVRDFGGTKYSAGTLPSGAPGSSLPANFIMDQDITVGFSISPKFGASGYWSVLLEAGRLAEYSVALAKKFKASLELSLGGFGSDALLGLRAGLNSVGLSYGMSLNLGLIQLEYSSQAQDIGVANARVLERRHVAVLSFNVARE